jgi:hypothetical protein
MTAPTPESIANRSCKFFSFGRLPDHPSPEILFVVRRTDLFSNDHSVVADERLALFPFNHHALTSASQV